MLPDGQPAEHDVAEEMPAQAARGSHHPTHAERRAEFFGVAGVGRVRSNDLLKRDDVRVDIREHGRNSRRDDPPIEPPATMNVVGGDPQIRVAAARSLACAMNLQLRSLQRHSPLSRTRGLLRICRISGISPATEPSDPFPAENLDGLLNRSRVLASPAAVGPFCVLLAHLLPPEFANTLV